MSDELVECELHEILNCAICKRADEPKAAETHHVGGADVEAFTFRGPQTNTKIAEFDGTCPACLEEIVAHYDAIIFDTFHDAWVHQACP